MCNADEETNFWLEVKNDPEQTAGPFAVEMDGSAIRLTRDPRQKAARKSVEQNLKDAGAPRALIEAVSPALSACESGPAARHVTSIIIWSKRTR